MGRLLSTEQMEALQTVAQLAAELADGPTLVKLKQLAKAPLKDVALDPNNLADAQAMLARLALLVPDLRDAVEKVACLDHDLSGLNSYDIEAIGKACYQNDLAAYNGKVGWVETQIDDDDAQAMARATISRMREMLPWFDDWASTMLIVDEAELLQKIGAAIQDAAQ